MVLLTKDQALFDRDENEELLPVTRGLTILKKEGEELKEIQFIPVPRGKWLRLMKMDDVDEQDKVIIEEHLITPKLTFKEYSTAMKPLVMTAIMTAITASTLDIDPEKIKGQSKKELTEAEEVVLEKK